MIDTDAPSSVELAAAMISGTGAFGLTSTVKAISYRVPVADLAIVDAMAAKAGKSRNAMLNILVAAGIQEVSKSLSRSVLKQVREDSEYRLAELVDGVETVRE